MVSDLPTAKAEHPQYLTTIVESLVSSSQPHTDQRSFHAGNIMPSMPDPPKHAPQGIPSLSPIQLSFPNPRSRSQTFCPVQLSKLAQRLELPIAQLDARRPQHAHVRLEVAAQQLLRGSAGVVPHHKVVPVVMQHRAARDGARQREDAPVVDGPHHAAVIEDRAAGGHHDSVSRVRREPWLERMILVVAKGRRRRRVWIEWRGRRGSIGVLFHLGHIARSDLRQSSWLATFLP